MRPPSPREQRGSASIVLAAGLGAALVMTMGVADVATVLAARSSARTAADAAALAAAQEMAFATGADPAELAAAYADRNGAELTSCACAAGGAGRDRRGARPGPGPAAAPRRPGRRRPGAGRGRPARAYVSRLNQMPPGPAVKSAPSPQTPTVLPVFVMSIAP